MLEAMSTMNVSLPDELRSYVDEQVSDGGYGSTSEYVRDLIRRDKDRQQLRRVLLDGAASSRGPIADDSYFASVRDRIRSDA
jgi:antitoxin ParD1/3/4